MFQKFMKWEEELDESHLTLNKTPAKHWDVFRWKCNASSLVRTHDLVSSRQTHYQLRNCDKNLLTKWQIWQILGKNVTHNFPPPLYVGGKNKRKKMYHVNIYHFAWPELHREWYLNIISYFPQSLRGKKYGSKV